MIQFFNTFLYEPFYNALIFLTTVIPGADIGLAVVVLTLAVKFVLLPLTHKSAKTQARLRVLDPEIKKIKEDHKDDKQEQARKMMALYKEHHVSPFASCLVVLIQLPIIFALYWVFFKGLSVDPEVAETVAHMSGFVNTELLNTDILYSFVVVPEFIKTTFLGFIDMTDKSFLLALLAGVTQFFQMRLSLPPAKGSFFETTGSMKEDLAKNMSFQMRYILPIVIFVVAYTISAAVALYWTTNNIFSIIHESLVRRKMARHIGHTEQATSTNGTTEKNHEPTDTNNNRGNT